MDGCCGVLADCFCPKCGPNFSNLQRSKENLIGHTSHDEPNHTCWTINHPHQASKQWICMPYRLMDGCCGVLGHCFCPKSGPNFSILQRSKENLIGHTSHDEPNHTCWTSNHPHQASKQWICMPYRLMDGCCGVLGHCFRPKSGPNFSILQEAKKI